MTEQENAIKAQPSLNGKYIEEFDEHEPEQHIKIGQNNYILREMTDEGLGIWMKAVGRRVVKDKKGKIIKEDYRGFHSDLIALCLYDGNGTPVPKSLIQSWGAKTKNRLFSICQDMNGLTDKFEDEEKNSKEAGMDGGNDE